MTNNNTNFRDLLTGAAIGGVVGAVAALLVAPKSGRKIRKDIYDIYCDVADKTKEVAGGLGRRGHSMTKGMDEATCCLTDRAREAIENIKDWLGSSNEEFGESARDLAIGSLIGAVIGFTAGLLLAPESGCELRQDIADTYHDITDKTQDTLSRWKRKGKMYMRKKQMSSTIEDWLDFAQDIFSRVTGQDVSSKAEDWLDFAQDLIERLTGKAQEVGENVAAKGRKMVGCNKTHDILDWASLGLRAWQQLKK